MATLQFSELTASRTGHTRQDIPLSKILCGSAAHAERLDLRRAGLGGGSKREETREREREAPKGNTPKRTRQSAHRAHTHTQSDRGIHASRARIPPNRQEGKLRQNAAGLESPSLSPGLKARFSFSFSPFHLGSCDNNNGSLRWLGRQTQHCRFQKMFAGSLTYYER